MLERAGFWVAALSLVLAAGCGKPNPPARPEPKPAPASPPGAEPPAVLPFAPIPPILVRGVGFESPESVLYDAIADVYLVSNMNGGPMDEDHDGFISRLSPDGAVLELRWIEGGKAGVVLDSPKGMAYVGDTLYVADINVVRSFDRKTGAPLGKIAIVSASFLNDVSAAPDGTLYVSDSGLSKVLGLSEPQKNKRDAVYAINPRGVVSVLAQGADLGQPNGLWADAEGVSVVSMTGQLYHLSPQGARQPLATLPGAGLDGIVETPDGRLLVSAWETSTVYVAKPPPAALAFEPLIGELESPADLGYDVKRRQLLVPLLKENAVYVQQLP